MTGRILNVKKKVKFVATNDRSLYGKLPRLYRAVVPKDSYGGSGASKPQGIGQRGRTFSGDGNAAVSPMEQAAWPGRGRELHREHRLDKGFHAAEASKTLLK